MLNVIVLSVVVLNAFSLGVVMLRVVAPLRILCFLLTLISWQIIQPNIWELVRRAFGIAVLFRPIVSTHHGIILHLGTEVVKGHFCGYVTFGQPNIWPT
jgi:hypothetical protein